jgi:hypothetical protein
MIRDREQVTLSMISRRASQNASMMASVINRYCYARGLSWNNLATELQINNTQLTQLALCRRPHGERYQEDVEQIAAYIEIDEAKLAWLISQVERTESEDLRLALRQKRRNNPGISQSEQVTRSRKETVKMNKRRIWGIIGLLVVVALSLTAFTAFAQPNQTYATLVVNEGEATVAQTGRFLLVFPRQTKVVMRPGEAVALSTGDEIVLAGQSAAQLQLIDGSTVDLFENTQLAVTDLEISSDRYVVSLRQFSGRTLNRVAHLMGVEDRFEIRTPSSTASVRGTVFTVVVENEYVTVVETDEGTVVMTARGVSVDVTAGMKVTTSPDGTLEVVPQDDDQEDDDQGDNDGQDDDDDAQGDDAQVDDDAQDDDDDIQVADDAQDDDDDAQGDDAQVDDDAQEEPEPEETTIEGIVIAVEGGQATIQLSDGSAMVVNIADAGEYEHPIVELLNEYFSGAGAEDWAAALEELGNAVGEFKALALVDDGTGNMVWQVTLMDNSVVTITDPELAEALGVLNVSLTGTVDGETGEVTVTTEVGGQIQEYHENGFGFGVLVKLYAIADTGVASVEELAGLFKDEGWGMGQIFKEYGKPELLGAGHVKQALGEAGKGKLKNKGQEEEGETLESSSQDQDQNGNPNNPNKPDKPGKTKEKSNNGKANGKNKNK